ncbi:MFS general substrate transporter [Cristinia sonorae]|uniref:MFS general substrate transporter n=1 Tax=Cristinia sonorae TaxID=1940300 RepID=A0A8K0XPE1_9AGAR|nr:MFS general substrate transporter [Cristinia sonorae]
MAHLASSASSTIAPSTLRKPNSQAFTEADSDVEKQQGEGWLQVLPGDDHCSVDEKGSKREADYEVQFAEGDKENPHNWPVWKKWAVTVLSGALVLNATLASSLPAGNLSLMRQDLHFSAEVGNLTLSLFVLGFAFGPILWGPLSEQYGRRMVYIISFSLYMGSQIGCALAPNTAAILAFRLLGGMFAAAPLTNSGGMISDMFDAASRAKPVAAFTVTPFAGPTLAPLISGYMAESGVSWRWVYWLETIVAGVFLFIALFIQPESFKPVVLANKAARMRKETGDTAWWAPHEKQRVPFIERMKAILTKPFKMLVTEPMLMAMTIYMSFMYGVMYLFFESYPIVFAVGHHMSAGHLGLTFLPICVGGIIGGLSFILIFGSGSLYRREAAKHAPHPVPPEFRLIQCIYAAPMFPIAIFWFGWTSFPSVSFWAPVMAGFPVGFSVVWIFLGMFAYIIDTYLAAAASALAVAVIVRSLFGAAFPLFATQMYEGLGPHWASTILGCIAAILTPIPYVLIKFGPKLRQMSKASQAKEDASKAPYQPGTKSDSA